MRNLVQFTIIKLLNSGESSSQYTSYSLIFSLLQCYKQTKDNMKSISAINPVIMEI